jgi:hypothetical protein
MTMRRALLALAAGAALSIAGAVPAGAAPSHSVPGGARWTTFGDGHWAPHVGNGGGHGLVTTSSTVSGTVTYGGAQMKANMLPTTNPTKVTALSYTFEANMSGNDGGSPRMVVTFSDGGHATLLQITWTATTWTTVTGMTTHTWTNAGGTCGFLYRTTWSTIKGCHPTASITGVFVVNDSGWLYKTGEQVVLDNLTVNGTVAKGPGASS